MYNALAQESRGLNEEFKHYLSQAVVHLKYDPILYWQEHKNSIYHHVHSIALMYMGIVGSSVFQLPETSQVMSGTAWIPVDLTDCCF